MALFANLPNEITRNIYDTAVGIRNVDVYNEIMDNVRDVINLVFDVDALRATYFVPYFKGSKKNIVIEEFDVDNSFEGIGINSITIDFTIGNERFCVFYTTYKDQDNEVSLKIEDFDGKFHPIVTSAYRKIFPTGIIY